MSTYTVLPGHCKAGMSLGLGMDLEHPFSDMGLGGSLTEGNGALACRPGFADQEVCASATT